MLLLVVAIGFMMHFTKQGLSWSNQQTALRSRDFFLVVTCVTVPLIANSFYFDTKESFEQLSSLPDVQQILASDSQHIATIILHQMSLVIAIFGFVAAVCKSPSMLDQFVFCRGVQTISVIGLGLYISVRYFLFDWVSMFGSQSYFELHWTDLLK